MLINSFNKNLKIVSDSTCSSFYEFNDFMIFLIFIIPTHLSYLFLFPSISYVYSFRWDRAAERDMQKMKALWERQQRVQIDDSPRVPFLSLN